MCHGNIRDHCTKNATRDANNKQRMTAMGHISAKIENGNKEAFTFEERYQELGEMIKQEAAAAKSNLKLNEEGRTAGTTEVEAEREK